MAKKKRRRRRKHPIIGIIKFLIILTLLIGLLGTAAYFFCTLKTVKVTGTSLYTDEEITGYLLDDEYCTNTVYAFLKNNIKPKGNAEFIDHFEVRMTGLNSLTIKCVEKTILGYIVDDDTYIYFDYNGKISEVSTTFVEGYMKVSCPTEEEPVVGDSLPIGEDKVGFLVSCIKLVEKNDLMPNEVSYDEYGRMTLVYDSYDILIGNSNYLEEKIDRILYILPQIEGMSGTLHLENFSNDNTDIVFEKAIDEEE